MKMNEHTEPENAGLSAEELSERESDGSRINSAAEDKTPYEDLKSENDRLSAELDELKKKLSEREEKEDALRHLESLVGSRTSSLYENAVRRGEEQEELKGLPYKKRYELGCLLCLGEERLKQKKEDSGKSAPPPVFAGSHGGGTVPSTPMKIPKDFETARENAKKYFGGR